MSHPLIDQAVAGQTVTIPVCELACLFHSEADLQAWCTVYGLQYQANMLTSSYTISKLPG